MKHDVVIVGGGLTGAAAAIAAAREGIDVLLIEKGNSLGGAIGNSLVNPFMVNATKINGVFTELSQGIFLEIRDELNRFADKYQPDRKHTNVNTFHEEYLKLILNRKAIESGVHLLYHCCLVGAETQDGKITSIQVASPSGIWNIEGNVFIDTTGDMNLGTLAGCEYMLGREQDHLCQPMTLCFRLGNVDLKKYIANRDKITPLYQQFKEQGKIKNHYECVLIFHTVMDGILHFNSTRAVKYNPVDPVDLTKAEIEVREYVFELYDFLRENIDGFQNACLLSTAAEIGIRESRKLVGEYVLNKDDLVSCKMFEDSIALGNYDIDIHNPEGGGTSHYYFPEGEYYSIPYRSLLPKEITNLLVAGRCISETHEAQASTRILPIVCCLGEAAGLAASLAIKESISPKNVNIQELHALLKKNGALY